MAKITTLSCDIETFGSNDLSKCGVYKYTEADDFEILLFAYSVDYGETNVIDLANGKTIPQEIINAISDPTIIKWAFNAQFERICLSKWLGMTTGQYLDPQSWRCTMVWSAYMGLPLSLAGVGAVLGLEKQKLKEGRDLIRYFSIPCKSTKINGGRIRNFPSHAPEKWQAFKEYNAQDVEVELAIQEKLSKFHVPDNIWEEYRLDQEINDRGVMLDMTFVKKAIKADEQSRSELTALMQELTELDNPNSVAQMKQWLADNGLETDSLGKKVVAELLKTAPQPLGRVLELRQQLAKSSVRKYQAMENCVCEDNRARGLFQFYGANRTGRAAGRILQPQNLPQTHMADLEQVRGLLKSGNFAAMQLLYDSIPDVLSELIRTAFVPKGGNRFIVADYSSIEAVVLAWLAGEKWTLEAYAAKRDLYIENAEIMFYVPKGSVDKKSPLRQKSKIAVLACGYGGSVGALKAFGALDMGLKEEELKPLVDAWRMANPNIVRFWWDVDREVKMAVKERTTTQTHGIKFSYQSGMLFITLPSGRRLSYIKPRIGENRFGGESVTYEGVGATKKWERIESYGPKFVENIVQGISRDILYYAMQLLNNAGYSIVMHCHDEVIAEVPLETCSLEDICAIITQPPLWANGLKLRADGFACDFYKKD